MGKSLKRLDGWEPKQITKVTKWRGDQPAEWETVTEPEWDGRERRWMLALALYESTLCSRCGQGLDETTDPNTDPDRPEASRRWVAQGPTECFCCKVMVRAEKKLREDENSGGMEHWAVFTPAIVAKKPRVRRRNR